MPTDYDREEIRKAMYNLDEKGDPMDKEKQEELNYSVKELKREKEELKKLIDGLRLKRGGIMEEMDSAHFDFKKTVKVGFVHPVAQGIKFAVGFWLGTFVLILLLKLVLGMIFGISVDSLISSIMS